MSPETATAVGAPVAGRTGAPVLDRAMEALATVRDPELDEAVTTLGFVAAVEVDAGAVRVDLRLPTYFCAPNFAWLMVADAKAALRRALGEHTEVVVRLVDHFASDTINRGVGGGTGFEGAFGAEAGGNLDELRALFRRKAYSMRQERLCKVLLDAGHTAKDLAAMTLAELPPCAQTDEYLSRRADLGLDLAPTAAFLVGADGAPVAAESLAQHLRVARTLRVSVEGNAAFCMGMLRTRYGLGEPGRSEPSPAVSEAGAGRRLLPLIEVEEVAR
jgi:metal-sulfur cluster biosynthetic enzyme